MIATSIVHEIPKVSLMLPVPTFLVDLLLNSKVIVMVAMVTEGPADDIPVQLLAVPGLAASMIPSAPKSSIPSAPKSNSMFMRFAFPVAPVFVIPVDPLLERSD